MDISEVLLLIAVAVLGYFYFQGKNKKRIGKDGKELKEIPGPKGLPIVGNKYQFSDPPNKKFSEWSRKFGDIYQFKMMDQKIVMISDPKWSKEILMDNLTTGKPNFIENMEFYDQYPRLGLFYSEGEMWEQHRRFMMRQLRDFGFGKSSLEGIIMDEVNEVLGKWKSQSQTGKPIGPIKHYLKLATVNGLWQLMAGERFDLDDPKLNDLARRSIEGLDLAIEITGSIFSSPWLLKTFPEWSGYTKIKQLQKDCLAYYEKVIEQHKKTLDENNMRDFIDVYLSEVRKTTDPNSVFYGEKAEKQLVVTLNDMFLAGTDTSSTAIDWSVLYLITFPEVQKKLREEILATTGNSRNVSLQDRPNMPYAVAFLEELLRYSSFVPENDPHIALQDMEFKGYLIEKGSWIQVNSKYIHFDKKLWGDPENFRPDRFLVDDGNGKKKFQRGPNLFAFGSGKRVCAGETLARDNVFLYVTNLVQQFNIEKNPNEPNPSLEGTAGIIQSPQPYSVIMKERV